jgi:hypothetical protein
MSNRNYTSILFMLCSATFRVWGQGSSGGTITVTVLDQTGAMVPDASLELKDIATNDVRRATTPRNGTYLFQDLPFGTYRLTITATGFQVQAFQSVQVQTGRVTDVRATLNVGTAAQKIEVTANATPLIETESSALADTIDTGQVVDLPVVGRSVMSLAFLVPGWSSIGGPNSTNGTWDNMPGGAVVSADFDGTPGISNRFRSGGFNYGTTAVLPRMEDVAEMTVQTGQLDLGGTGTSAMRISIVTRRGSNEFHGRVFEDFRNSALNANSWSNNANRLPRNIVRLNDFGASVGGPIRKNKIFFFGTWAQSIQPGTNNSTVQVLNPAAQRGLFNYTDGSGRLQTVNLLQIAGNAGYPSTVLPNVSNQFQKINGVLNLGTLTQGSDPNLSTLAFQTTSKTNVYFPTVRLDYAATENVRVNLSYSQTKTDGTHVNAPAFPGGIDPLNYTSSNGNNRIAGIGVDWTIRPTMMNEFHAGYMYQYRIFDPENLGIDLPNIYQQTWNYGQALYQSSIYPRLPISSFYPLLSANDSLSWQRGAHSFVFGGSWYREQDHYWNGPGGFPNYTFGIASGDPLSAVFTSALAGLNNTGLTNAQNLYAELTGRISAVNIAVGRPLDPSTKQYKPFGAYNLDEVQAAGGVWAQDRWRLRSNLTLNYGLRWDIVGDDHDVNGGYSTLRSPADLWGPTTVGAIFKPGTLGGAANPMFQAGVHVYKTSLANFSPAVAVAWSPQLEGGILARIFPKDRTVVRTGYSLRHYLEGAQNFWAFASNSGQFFFQQGQLNPNTTASTGTFQPGTLTFGDPLPPYFLSPSTYSASVPAANLFNAGQFYGMNPNIGQPYVEQWNFGVQRQIGSGSAIEARYVGNLSMHQWLSYNINEVNIFENGFLNEFINAQNNLKINQTNGKGNTFANNGLPGQVPLPIFSAAFAGVPASSGFASGTFITNLNTGAAGTLATSLANNPTFFCNMVGTANFSAPCLSKGVNSPGAGYPINFWQVNPYATGRAVNYLDAAGHSNYHGLQLEFRQRLTHGMQFNVNYTWAHSLGIAAQNGIQGQGNNIYYTARNFRLNYGPSLFDIRHVVHASGTYELPFGKGKTLLNHGGLVNAVFGGWTLGTIVAWQSGSPAVFGSNNNTDGFNTANNTDAGVVLNGVTLAQLQKSVGVFTTGQPWVTLIDPKYIGSNGQANPNFISPQTTPGVWGYRPYLYGPRWFNTDLSVNKAIPIRESVRMVLQGEFLNVFNHPTFALTGATVNNLNILAAQNPTFGQATSGPTSPRVIELRANIEF